MSIDLGFERPSWDRSMKCSPEEIETKVVYPTVYIDSDKNLDLPKKGKITFEYEMKSKTSREGRDEEAKYSCELELKAIESSEKSATKKEKSPEESIDNLRKKKDTGESDDNYSDESDE